MMGVQLVLVVALTAAGGLRVETGTPAALCPDLGQVRQAVGERLGEIEGDGEWLARYTLVHRPGADMGDVVRLDLRDPAGRLRLRRDLPRAGESCVNVAQALVLVLESYFRHPTDHQVAAANPPAAATAAATVPPPRAESPLSPSIDLLGGWSSGPSSPAVALDVWLVGRSGWAAAVQAAWLTAQPEQSRNLGDGQTATWKLQGTTFRGCLARRLRPADWLEVFLGPELVLDVDRVTPTGSVGTANTRAAFGAGARAQLRVRIAPHLSLSFMTAVDYTPADWAGRFEVNGLPGETFPAPRVRVLTGLGMGVNFFQ